jgi:flavin reductase (DIM6/NTAB) family NADH-FMN oxidoreductase RutF
MTVSSFTTLTLTPTPIVTFNIRTPSRTLDAIRESREFLIHILSATESGARVSHVFTQGNNPSATTSVFTSPEFGVATYGRKGEAQLPLLAADGVIKVLRCRLHTAEGLEQFGGLVPVGDHVLVLANVVGIVEPPRRADSAEGEEKGLSYLDRAYRYPGSVIDHVRGQEDDNLDE